MYKRVLIKLSGEALAGSQKTGLDHDTVHAICASIKKIYDLGTEVAIVVGGGNFWRARSSGEQDRTRADHLGLLSTAMLWLWRMLWSRRAVMYGCSPLCPCSR